MINSTPSILLTIYNLSLIVIFTVTLWAVLWQRVKEGLITRLAFLTLSLATLSQFFKEETPNAAHVIFVFACAALAARCFWLRVGARAFKKWLRSKKKLSRDG
jgi:hypothetical protein